MTASAARKAQKIDAPKRSSVVPLAAAKRAERERGPSFSWTAANIQGRLRGIASALDDLANGATFNDDNGGWLMEVLVQRP